MDRLPPDSLSTLELCPESTDYDGSFINIRQHFLPHKDIKNMSQIIETSEEDLEDDDVRNHTQTANDEDPDAFRSCNEDGQDAGVDDNAQRQQHQQDLQEQMMIKYWRSKSLPVACYPPHQLLLIQQQQQQFRAALGESHHDEHQPLEYLTSTSSGGSGSGSGTASGQSTNKKNLNNIICPKGKDLKVVREGIIGTSHEQVYKNN